MPSYFDKYLNQEINFDTLMQQANLLMDEEPYNVDLDLSRSEFELFKRLGDSALDEILAARKKKEEIILKWKDFFRNEIAKNHRKNTLKLKHQKEFNLNPFLDKYKANFLLGDSSPKSIATALIYARTLGTSINTTFGTSLQKFCSSILSGYASTTSGIDIEFIDFVDGRKKYCQIKAGPNTINKDDVPTIINHFTAVKNLARTNHLDIGFNDLIIGVFYGTEKELSVHYKKIAKEYPVYIGQDFWYRLTGDINFYHALTSAVDEVAAEYDGRELLNEVIDSLANDITKSENEKS